MGPSLQESPSSSGGELYSESYRSESKLSSFGGTNSGWYSLRSTASWDEEKIDGAVIDGAVIDGAVIDGYRR
eukprot:scaffold964_cov261-Pinguiococcus_pyrenoidosus.AAC.15